MNARYLKFQDKLKTAYNSSRDLFSNCERELSSLLEKKKLDLSVWCDTTWYEVEMIYLPFHIPAWSTMPIAPLGQPDSPLSWLFRAPDPAPSARNLSPAASPSKPPKSTSQILTRDCETIAEREILNEGPSKAILAAWTWKLKCAIKKFTI